MAGALAWFREEAPPGSTVLAAPNSGYLIAGWGGQQVYAGHWVNTVDLEVKMDEIAGYYISQDDLWQRAFLDDRQIDFVFFGEDERRRGYSPSGFGHLREIHRSGEVTIFEFIR
jgi:hypothetical protein